MNIKNLENARVEFTLVPLVEGAQGRFLLDLSDKAYIYDNGEIIERLAKDNDECYVPMTVVKSEIEKFDIVEKLLKYINGGNEYLMIMPYLNDKFGAALFKQK